MMPNFKNLIVIMAVVMLSAMAGRYFCESLYFYLGLPQIPLVASEAASIGGVVIGLLALMEGD